MSQCGVRSFASAEFGNSDATRRRYSAFRFRAARQSEGCRSVACPEEHGDGGDGRAVEPGERAERVGVHDAGVIHPRPGDRGQLRAQGRFQPGRVGFAGQRPASRTACSAR